MSFSAWEKRGEGNGKQTIKERMFEMVMMPTSHFLGTVQHLISHVNNFSINTEQTMHTIKASIQNILHIEAATD